MEKLNATANKILDAAERLTMRRGFNAFSYKDLEQEVGVKTSSIHYHFSTKQDLAMSLIERYTDVFHNALEQTAENNERGIDQLHALGQIYLAPLSDQRFCLCGMLSSDMVSLPVEVNDNLSAFFTMIETWVEQAIVLGQQQQNILPSVKPKDAASHFLAALEGGMLIARSYNRPAYLEVVVEEVLSRIAA